MHIFGYCNHDRILLYTWFPNVRTYWTCTSFRLPVPSPPHLSPRRFLWTSWSNRLIRRRIRRVDKKPFCNSLSIPSRPPMQCMCPNAVIYVAWPWVAGPTTCIIGSKATWLALVRPLPYKPSVCCHCAPLTTPLLDRPPANRPHWLSLRGGWEGQNRSRTKEERRNWGGVDDTLATRILSNSVFALIHIARLHNTEANDQTVGSAWNIF